MRTRLIGWLALVLTGSVLAQDASRDAVLEALSVIALQLSGVLETEMPGIDAATRESLVPSVAAWVASLRDDALERGAAAMPREIHAALSGHVPANVLDAVRWRVEGDATFAGQSLFQLGGVRALTLDHVIVFANAEEAADATLWAHEVYHVMQFAQWGIDGFVDRYLADRNAVEHEAWEFRWAWMKATGRVPSA